MMWSYQCTNKGQQQYLGFYSFYISYVIYFPFLPPFKNVTGCYAILLLLHKKLLATIKVRFWFILPQANSAANSCGVLAGFIFDSSFSVCGEVEHA